MCQTTLARTIKELVVNDYFTPNIKAEVILDTLLTPYIGRIVKSQMSEPIGNLVLLTKEMSLEESEEGQPPKDDRGAKIDYLLEGKDVYLVELKTTSGSINDEQAIRYLRYCCEQNGKPRTFGDVFGEKLLRIIKKNYGKYIFHDRLADIFQDISGNCGRDEHARKAVSFLKANKLAATYKYLYTVGQILDQCPDLDALWGKRLRLVYITPNGMSPHNSLLSAAGFYLHPEKSESINLKDAVNALRPEPDDKAYVDLLQSIIAEIL